MFIFGLVVLVCALICGVIAWDGVNRTFMAVCAGCGAGLFILIWIFTSLYVVNPGEVGVEVLFGKVIKYSENGLRGKNPFADVEKFDIKTVRGDFRSEGMSKDMQLVIIESIVNYRIDFTRIADLYTKVGRDYYNKVVVPAVEQTIKAVCSQYKVEEITVNREAMKERAQIELSTKLSNYYVIVQDISLADIDFSAEFNKVVEEKQLEEQKIKTAEYRKKQAEQDKQTTILQAQAESEKQRLLRDTTSKEVIELKRIEKWDGHYPTVLGGNNLLNIKLPE